MGRGIDNSWKILGDNYKKANLNNIADIITDIIISAVENNTLNNSEGISW